MTKQILLIDDDIGVRQIVQTALETVVHWKVTTVDSGPTGVQLAQTKGFDAILLDVMMPGQDGIKTLEQLREISIVGDGAFQIPVIFLTAKVRNHERAALLSLDVAGLIMKPFKASQLANEIQSILNWS